MIYLDTSAFLKTVWQEPESAALSRAIGDKPTVSSALLAVEARRSTLRVAADQLPRTDLMLADVNQIELTPALLESASRLPDPMLRSLDAIHLATALLIREEVDVLLSYDQRLLDAAAEHGLPTAAPA
ncbi:type II toxin-antitoxin system VapC family toxin [Pseudonocardia nigra]|uniref:type II toxin-antitoxin system VapC family toxin n=1 Tax=Pseudonocardia nigra TaxID=1921578 RepID=UPI001C6006FA|nr:type II toxin-antitoxin system VapC family toxin [Pseudonocardia nigra]